MTKWVVAFIIAMSAAGNGFPIFFTDQMFRSLEELDEALANGEITQEYYDEAVDVFATVFGPNSRFQELPPRTVPTQEDQQLLPEWKFTTAYRQDLQAEYSSTRYDRVSFRTRGSRGGLSIEKKIGHPCLVRSLLFTLRRPRLQIDFGGIAPQYASGVTVGNSGLHQELHSSADLRSSLLYPTQHRKNGIGFRYEFLQAITAAFVSRIKGDRSYSQSFGGDFTMTAGWADFGVVMLHQQVGQFGAASRKLIFLAPHLRKRNFSRSFAVESSFQVNGAAAHLMQYEFRTKEHSQSYILFSYAADYQNLESGGYAYSDYEDAILDDVGLEYREKRAGRTGIAIEQTLNFHPEKLTGQLVRWQDRLDDRQCVAGRLTFEQSDRIQLLSRLRVQAIYQNLDIEHNTDIRELITVSTELRPSAFFIYENQHKIEQRVLNVSKKYPFRSRHDFTWKLGPELESIAMINYYDSDLNSDGNAQLTLAVGQDVKARRDFRFSGRLQSRYKFSTRRLDNWELRVNLEVIL